MPNIDNLLAHQRQVEPQQEIVGLVDGTRGGVLDRQHRAIGMPFQNSLEHRLEGRVRLEGDAAPRDGEVLQRRLVAVGPFRALEPDANFLGVSLALQHVLLPPHRVVQNLAEDPAHEGRVESQPLAERGPMLQERRLSIGVADGPVAGRLHLRNLPRQPCPLAQCRHQNRIDVVEALA
jgi:hypothetical protein